MYGLFSEKVDYGEDYEKNRVQEGYPRVRGADLERVKQSIDDRDTEAVDDFSKSDANGIDQCIAFLESLLAPTWKTSAMKLKRALVVAVTLRNRVEGIQKEGDQEDEVARLVKKNVLHRVRVVIHKLCTAIGDVQHLKAAICSMPMLKDAFIKCIEFLSPNDLEARDFTTFLATLWTSPED